MAKHINMRTTSLIGLLLILLSIVSIAQDKLPKNTISIDNTSKNELYNRAKKWTANNFRSSKDVIQLDDKEAGKIIIRGITVYNAPAFNPGTAYSGNIIFTFSFDCKDGKYKYEYTDAEFEPYNQRAWNSNFNKKKLRRKVNEYSDNKLKKLSIDFENQMKLPYKIDNW